MEATPHVEQMMLFSHVVFDKPNCRVQNFTLAIQLRLQGHQHQVQVLKPLALPLFDFGLRLLVILYERDPKHLFLDLVVVIEIDALVFEHSNKLVKRWLLPLLSMVQNNLENNVLEYNPPI